MSKNLSPFLANSFKTGCLQEKCSSLRLKMSEKENYFMRERRSAAGNSRSRRSAAPFDPIRGRELAGRSAFSLIFLPQNKKFLKNRPSFTFFQKTARADPRFLALKVRICALVASDQRFQVLKRASDSQIDPLQPMLTSIQKQPELKRRRTFLKNQPSFTFFQKTKKAVSLPRPAKTCRRNK